MPVTMDELLNPETDERIAPACTVCLYDFCVTRAWFNSGLSFDIAWQRLDGKRRLKSKLPVLPKCSLATLPQEIL